MNFNHYPELMNIFVLQPLLIPGAGCIKSSQKEEAERAAPNILWITSEGMSPHPGCYGDELSAHIDWKNRYGNLENLTKPELIKQL
jgi:hypothetical protein